jgi:hypothetical protein
MSGNRTDLTPESHRASKTPHNTMSVIRAVFTHGPNGPGPRAANFQGWHIKKKLILKYGMRIKRRLSTREKFNGDLH